MANQEHLEILKKGVDAWNQWREEHPDTPPDLQDAHLRDAHLRGANLRWAHLSEADLTETNLSRADLSRTTLHSANLSKADLAKANLNNAHLRDAHLCGAKLCEADLRQADLRGVDLRGANLRGADLSEADLTEANLSQADVSGTTFHWANLSKADLGKANLSNANLREADLSFADLAGADLSRADLSMGNLTGADFSRADPSMANLTGANLLGTRFHNVNLLGADLSGAYAWLTTFDDVDLSEVKGLEKVQHGGPSTIGIDTVYRSQGRIPEVFLRGAGVSDEFIALIKSVAGSIQFYSCFISYSSKDQEFADRLHADLQDNGVRCWLAAEDLKIGDKFRQRIDEAIRVHDKLLVVLSKTSVKSSWVESEVETAFERERGAKGKKLVLFPIRLDDAVMKAKQAWAGEIRRTRHIGDFTQWRDHDSYKKAFERLLRDLRGEKEKEAAAE